MNCKSAIIGIVLGSIIVVLIKPKDATTAKTKVTTDVHTVAKSTESSTLVTPVVVKSQTTIVKENDHPMTSENVACGKLLDDSLGFDHNPLRLRQLLQESIEDAHVTNSTQTELDNFEHLFLATLQQSDSWTKLTQDWSQEGWKLERWEADGDKFAAICEKDGQRRGRGIYVIRVDTHSPIVLQAPHRFFDTKTGLLNRKFFTEHDVLAAAWNTVHREKIDLAHRSDHFINAMTRALIKYDASTVVAQVHGFANEKQTGAASFASVIISDTTPYPGRLVRRVAEGLKDSFGAERVCLYPIEVSELGGTQNHQAQVFHRFGQTGFLHVELNQQMRGKLVSDASARVEFFSALTHAVGDRDIPPNR